MANKYSDYFEVNEEYFPCFDESAINNGANWDDTYPHAAFVELLNATERMLGGKTNKYGSTVHMELENQSVHMH